MREALLGFDAKEWPFGLNAWTEQRRSTYLIRREVQVVMSIDPLVWPSVLTAPDTAAIGWPVRNTSARLFADLGALNRMCPRGMVVATTLALEGLSAQESDCAQDYLWGTVPRDIDRAWGLLGYDVASLSPISALANCGYSANDAATVRNRWATVLNDWHLFPDWSSADEFRRYSNARVAEEAPFYVYGLYRVAQQEG